MEHKVLAIHFTVEFEEYKHYLQEQIEFNKVVFGCTLYKEEVLF